MVGFLWSKNHDWCGCEITRIFLDQEGTRGYCWTSLSIAMLVLVRSFWDITDCRVLCLEGKTSAELEAEEARAWEEVKRYRKICNDLGDKLWLRKFLLRSVLTTSFWLHALDRCTAGFAGWVTLHMRFVFRLESPFCRCDLPGEFCRCLLYPNKIYHEKCLSLIAFWNLLAVKHPVMYCLVIVAACDDAFHRNPADPVKAHGDWYALASWTWRIIFL